ncbi:MAG: hypothetical protein ACRDZP_01215 [Acidimicrobiales bacterium]
MVSYRSKQLGRGRHLIRLADALGVSSDYLIDGASDDAAQPRLTEVLNVSIDHLLVDDVPRRPLHSAEDVLGDRRVCECRRGAADDAVAKKPNSATRIMAIRLRSPRRLAAPPTASSGRLGHDRQSRRR